ncbi:MAG: hypothetical protein FJ143_17540 [Deltaproteobacteria bacterium]|nr:hypothetical protein [Deltaproteobacteria bacterium]
MAVVGETFPNALLDLRHRVLERLTAQGIEPCHAAQQLSELNGIRTVNYSNRDIHRLTPL